MLGIKIQFWHQQFEADDFCRFSRHAFQTTELVVMYLCSEVNFGLRRSCTVARQPEFWLSGGFVQTRRKSHRKVTAYI